MKAIAIARSWLRRMAAAAPSAWQYDPVFRWSAIGAGLAMAMFILQLTESAAPRGSSPVPAASVPRSLGSTYGVAGSSLAPTPPPKIAPGRSLDGVTITPAPGDPFGTMPTATHK